MDRCCDNCKWYDWYWDSCVRYQCIVNNRSICDNWEERFAEIERVIDKKMEPILLERAEKEWREVCLNEFRYKDNKIA